MTGERGALDGLYFSFGEPQLSAPTPRLARPLDRCDNECDFGKHVVTQIVQLLARVDRLEQMSRGFFGARGIAEF